MSRDRKSNPVKKADLAKRIREDKACIPCHDSQGGIKKEIYLKRTSMGISGTLYCPKDKMKFPSGTQACSKCGGPLLDMNKLMTISRTRPSNEICRQCHAKEEVQQLQQHASLRPAVLNGCLDCHKGHNDCGNCHH